MFQTPLKCKQSGAPITTRPYPQRPVIWDLTQDWVDGSCPSTTAVSHTQPSPSFHMLTPHPSHNTVPQICESILFLNLCAVFPLLLCPPTHTPVNLLHPGSPRHPGDDLYRITLCLYVSVCSHLLLLHYKLLRTETISILLSIFSVLSKLLNAYKSLVNIIE